MHLFGRLRLGVFGNLVLLVVFCLLEDEELVRMLPHPQKRCHIFNEVLLLKFSLDK